MRIIFAGTPDFALPAMRALLASEHSVCAVYTQPDRPAGRGRSLTASPVKQLALAADIPVFQPQTLNADSDIRQFDNLKADLMVVVAYGIILPQAVIDAPKLGCVNIHGSLLPRWRGAAPIQRALMAGDRETGVTIMRVVKKLDAGDMLLKEVCEILPEDTSKTLHDRLAEMGAHALVKVIDQLECGTAIAEPQDESLVTYASKLHKGEALLDWNASAAYLERQVRGLNPWPIAQTYYRDQVLRIWQAQAIAGVVEVAPGTVVCHDHCVDVATGDGWLRLLDVQLPGRKRMDIQAFVNAHEINGVVLTAHEAA